jgi:[ribosomal protein S5]-alanine N-acetyltransferase
MASSRPLCFVTFKVLSIMNADIIQHFVPLQSERIALRLVQDSDLADLLIVHSQDDVTRYLPYKTWNAMTDARAWYERAMKRHAESSALQLAVLERGSGQTIGTCMLFGFDETSGLAEIGYVLGRAHWGRGYAREALAMLLNYAFGAMGLRRIEANIDARNTASVVLIEKLGFAQEGRLRQRWVTEGVISDALIYGLLRDEWLARQSQGQRSVGGL